MLSLSLAQIAALLAAMALLAALPSVSVMTVVARSASLGLAHGAATSLGIVAGDLVFVVIAITGLSVLSQALGGWFAAVKYLGAFYLVVTGLALLRSRGSIGGTTRVAPTSLGSSFMAGLLITLADQKAILFYLAFFPAFVGLGRLTAMDGVTIVGVTCLSVGGVKMIYAAAARGAAQAMGERLHGGMAAAAGIAMVIAGLVVVARA